MKRRSGLCSLAAAGVRTIAAVAAALALVTHGSSAQTSDDEQMYNDVMYACTGIGNSKWDPRWKEYPAKIVFAAGTGVYLADNQAVITERNGPIVFEGHCYAPWLMVGLRPGRYTVTGTVQGFTHSADFVVHDGQQTFVVVRFPEIEEH
jgi:hypothetical protein